MSRLRAANLGWIIIGRRVVVIGAQTTRNRVVTVNSLPIRTGVAWNDSLNAMSDDMSRFGIKSSCGGLCSGTESD
jgi:hypothetical protein